MDAHFTEILHKVRDLYLRYGIKSITMDDVSSHLGISKKTLYQYVKDKNELVAKVIDCQIDTIQDDSACAQNKGLNAIEDLLVVSKMLNQMLKQINPAMEYDLKKYYPEHYQRFMTMRREHMYTQIIRNIQKGKEEKWYRAELNETIIAKFQLSRIEFIMQSDLFTVEEFTSPKFFQEIFEYHIRGIANKQGIDFLENKLKDFDINDMNDLSPKTTFNP
jgi:AcrR family transcriptional regulator